MKGSDMPSHRWIRAGSRRSRDRLLAGLDLPPTLAVLDAHRRLRGPYTAAGTLIRQIADDVLARRPDLGAAHNVEILTCAPELNGRVPEVWTTLEWRVKDGERTRFYSRLHTRNIANGIAELLRDYLSELGGQPRTLVMENVHLADPTDQELAAVLLRRTDLGALTVVVGTGVEAISDPPGESTISLCAALSAHADQVVPTDGVADSPPPELTGDDQTLARTYVDSDGTADDPRLLAAYDRLPMADRAVMHDQRAAELTTRDEFSLLLGAVPYHAEHGSDPTGRGIEALRFAMDHCRGIGLYQATVDLGLRGRALVDPSTGPERWWQFTNAAGVAMSALGRAAEAESILTEARASTADLMTHLDLAYTMAMLHARHYPEDQRDYRQARAWMNLAIAIADQLPDAKERAFRSVFSRNGLALVEVREKRSAEALRLLEEGMVRLDRELAPDEHALHRLVLRYNRGQVFAGVGRLQEALADYTAVTEADPDFPEHHFNVGLVLQRMGRTEEAIAAYRHALTLSPPFPEAYYNLGEAHLELGAVTEAINAFGYAIELDPEHVDARINMAALLLDDAQEEAAWQEVTAGLELAPDNIHLLCLRARLLADRGEIAGAELAVAEALRLDGGMAEAWAIRGQLAYETGDLAGAISALDHAVEHGSTPEIRYNRAVLYEAAGRYADAVVDYDALLSDDSGTDDTAGVELRRDRCRQAAGQALGVG
jgi:tetratricopeptide (TPR) repeat protein